MSKKAFCFFKAIKKKITYIRSIIIPSTKVDSIKLKIMNIIKKNYTVCCNSTSTRWKILMHHISW